MGRPGSGSGSAGDSAEAERAAKKLADQADNLRKDIDKPNLHKLLELADVFLTDFLHGDFLAELPFEAAHQPLKRGIERSNWQRPHLATVTAALLNDWEGRLVALHDGARDGRDDYIRGCARLLLGPHAIEGRDCTGQGLDDEVRQSVLDSIGQDSEHLVADQLRRSTRRVTSAPREQAPEEAAAPASWVTGDPKEVASTGEQAAEGAQCSISVLARLASTAAFERARRSGQSVFHSATLQVPPGNAGGSRSPSAHGGLPCRHAAGKGAFSSLQCSFSSGMIVGLRASVDGRSESTELWTSLTLDGPRREVSVWCVVAVCAVPATSHTPGPIDVILLPCEEVLFEADADTDGAVPTCRPRALSPRSVWRVCKHQSTLPHLVTFAGNDDSELSSIEPLAVVPDCASLHSSGSCGVRKGDDSGPWLITHRSTCEPLSGGTFFIRDRESGFPPRSA